MTRTSWLLVGLAAATGAAAWYIRVLRERCRDRDHEIRRLLQRESQRTNSCHVFGHHLDSTCTCTRCLTAQHDFVLSSSRTIAVRNELVNPNADPGALYLDSNFQPDADYGLTQTVFETVKTYRCARCAHEMETRDEYGVVDER